MKLEHLIQAYKFNGIKVEEETIEDENERAGVLKFNKDINASYLLDDEDIVMTMILFCNPITTKEKTISNQLEHAVNVLKIVQKTIELMGNVKQSEANKILGQLGIFQGKIKTKAVRFLDHVYKVENVKGLLMFTIIEEEGRTVKKQK